MFTGFPSENTPAIQVYEFSIPGVFGTNPQVSLTNDCAPLQLFKTGGTNGSTIRVYLPSSPIEGKVITLVNIWYGNNSQTIRVYFPDVNANFFGESQFSHLMGPGQNLSFCYSKNFISGPGLYKTGWISIDNSPVSSNNYFSTVSGYNNAVTASYATIVGGGGNTVSGQYGIAGGQSCSTTGQSGTAFGFLSSAGQNALAVGGNAAAQSTGAVAIGGTSVGPSANGFCAVSIGESAFARAVEGKLSLSGHNNPVASNRGVSQKGLLTLGVITTNAITTTLRSNISAASTTNQAILPNNSAYYFRGTVIANVTGGGDTKAWVIEGAIKRGATAATTVMVGAPTVTSSYADAGAAAWVVAVAADTINGCIQVTVTGAAGITIRWVCNLETTEVTF